MAKTRIVDVSTPGNPAAPEDGIAALKDTTTSPAGRAGGRGPAGPGASACGGRRGVRKDGLASLREKMEGPAAPKACCGRCKAMRLVTSLWRGGMYAFDRNDAGLAETMQRQALEMLGELGGMAVVEARIRNNLGVILSCTQRRAAAAQEFARALSLLEGRVDPASRFHRIIAGNHAQVLGPGGAPGRESAGERPQRPLAVQ